MPRFTLRMNCEYTHSVEAESEEAAIEIGQSLETEQWNGYVWSGVEAEEE